MNRYENNDHCHRVRPIGPPRPLVGCKCGCKSRCKCKKDLVSAFKAVNLSDQTIPVDIDTKILYPNEQLDLANEYNPATSTFIPNNSGVYSIIASIEFQPFDSTNAYRIGISIRVNGVDIAINNVFSSAGEQISIAAVSTNVPLQAGDRVEVFAVFSTAGVVDGDSRTTRFEGSRFPSPT